MAPSFLPSEQGHASSAAWLLCATCAPFSEVLAEQAGLELRGEPEVEYAERRYGVKSPTTLLKLRQWVAENNEARMLISRLEAARHREEDKQRPLTHAEIAGSARAALVLGRKRTFASLYKRYAHEGDYEWHPDPEHFQFWDAVLGPGWEGADAVPAGAARNEIARMSAIASSFSAPFPGGIGGKLLCENSQDVEWLEVAAALRVADGDTLGEMMGEGSNAARAAKKFLTGAFSEAQSEFERLFGRMMDNRYGLMTQHGLPLLVYALVCGVLSGAAARFLKAWFDYARYMLQYAFSPLMSERQQEMMRFLNNLELVDELMNRQGHAGGAPELEEALSCLPFAMAYPSLPGSLRQHLNVDELAGAVDVLVRRDGLLLLARYGASGLLSAPTLSLERRHALEALLVEVDETSLPRLEPPASERACAALGETVKKLARFGSTLQHMRTALPPTLFAFCADGGEVCIDMEDDEYLSQWDDSPALRCMKKYARDGHLILEGMTAAEFTRFFVALEPQVDIAGSLAREDEKPVDAAPQPVILLSHEGGGDCLAAMRLRLWPGTTLLVTPGSGLGVPVVETAEGGALPVLRHIAAEYTLVEQAVASLLSAGYEEAGELANDVMRVDGFDKLAQLLRACRESGLETCWEKEHALQLHQPQKGLQLRISKGAADWLELGGGLQVDEERVLELSALLEGFAQRTGNVLGLGAGEYVMLSPEQERQLSLLELVWQEKQGRMGVSASAIPILEALAGGEASSAPSDKPAALPEGLRATLRPYQQEGYCWLAERAERGLGALLADDMGLGKTVQVLALLLRAAEKKEGGAALVVAPVSLLGNWAEEAARFAPALRVSVCEARKPICLEGLGAGELVLASYGQVASRLPDFAAVEWDMLVLDEAQAIKNPDSQRARAVCSLRARARLCLTGTPVENSLLDLWSQMRFLNPGLFGTRSSFQRRFRKTTPEQLALLRQALSPLVLRRTKAEVLQQLPALTEITEWVEFSREERALYESLRRAAVAKLGQGEAIPGGGHIGILAELTRLRRACCHGKLALRDFAGSSTKLAAMAERVETLRTAGRRVLIFSQFTDVLDLAESALQKAGCSSLRLDGRTPAAQRSEIVREFQKGGADALLISLKAGGAGLNLTAADYVILLDPWWNPAAEAQAAGRSHRLGQQQPVTLCRYVVRGTVEERILAMQRDKKELAESILSGGGEGLSLANLRALLTSP